MGEAYSRGQRAWMWVGGVLTFAILLAWTVQAILGPTAAPDAAPATAPLAGVTCADWSEWPSGTREDAAETLHAYQTQIHDGAANLNLSAFRAALEAACEPDPAATLTAAAFIAYG